LFAITAIIGAQSLADLFESSRHRGDTSEADDAQPVFGSRSFPYRVAAMLSLLAGFVYLATTYMGRLS
jgi:hypothetical protein